MKLIGLIFLVYGLTLLMGGVMGYLKVQSLVSLLSGLGFGLLILVSGSAILNGQDWGLTVGLSTTALLVLVFAYRFISTYKFMPAGMMLAVSLIVGLLVAFLHFKR
jgi:uncharacterized membrane protein (UPF0136 family)